eukprot:SAG11_NODE_711_length_7641_cov_103.798064_2_plen_302_part_00
MVDVQNYNNAYDTMQVSTTTLNQGNNVKIVKPKPKRYKAWDLEKERIISFTYLYGRSAKRLYRQYIDAGFDAGMLMPNDLQYYPISGRFVRKTESVKGITAHKGFLQTYSIPNKYNTLGWKGLELIKKFKPMLAKAITDLNGIKFYISVQCRMVKYLDDELLTDITRFVNSKISNILTIGDIDTKNRSTISSLKERIMEQEAKNGSMWIFEKVISIDLDIAKYKPLKGSSYKPLPKKLMTKKAIVNVQNTDDMCFKWAVLSALFPIPVHLERVQKYKYIEHGLDFDCIDFPTPLTHAVRLC